MGRAAPPVEETWDSEDGGTERWGRVRRPRGEGACGVVTRGPVSFVISVITVFTVEGETALRGWTVDRKRKK